MQILIKYLKKNIFFIMKCVSLGCLFFISVWSLSDYEFSNGLLKGFPMLCMPFDKIIADKKIAALFFPLVVNIVLWMPIRKSYRVLFGIFVVEKWKAMFTALGSVYFFLSSIIFYPQGSGEYFWSFFLPVVYFILLHYSLKKISGEEFLKCHDIKEKDQKIERQTLVVSLIYILVIVLYLGEYNFQRYYETIPVKPSIEYSIGNGFVKDISSNEEQMLSFTDLNTGRTDSKIPKGVVEVCDIETGNVINAFTLERGIYAQYGAIDNQIIAQKADYEKKEGWLAIYDTRTGEMIKEYPHINGLEFGLNKISYSGNKDYIAAVGAVVTICDSTTGNLLKKYKDLRYSKEFTWLADNQYFVIEKNQRKFLDEKRWKVELGEITKEGEVKSREKEKIEKILEEKEKGLYQSAFYINNLKDEKIIAVVMQGRPSNGWLYHKSCLMLLDVEKEEVVFSLNSNYAILCVEILPDRNHFVILEEMKADRNNRQRVRMTLWNMETKEKEKKIIMGGMPSVDPPDNIKIIQGGKKIIEFGKEIKAWNIN